MLQKNGPARRLAALLCLALLGAAGARWPAAHADGPGAHRAALYVPLAVRPREPSGVLLALDDGALEARVGATTTITATVYDARGPLPDYPVTFSATLGAISQAVVRTSADGIATTELTLDSAAIQNIGQITTAIAITARAGAASGDVVLQANAPPCNDIEDSNDEPAGAPELRSLDGLCHGSLQDDPAGEDDYYAIALDRRATLQVTLRGIPPGSDIDLQLSRYLGGGYQILAESARDGNQDEAFSVALPPGTYYLRVYLAVKGPGDNGYILGALRNP